MPHPGTHPERRADKNGKVVTRHVKTRRVNPPQRRGTLGNPGKPSPHTAATKPDPFLPQPGSDLARRLWTIKNQERGTSAGEAHYITRDEILNPDNRYGQDQWHMLSCETANGVRYNIVSTIGDGCAYGMSPKTGTVVRIVPTGTVQDNNGWVKCRVDYPVDTGDVAGTLVFRKRGDSVTEEPEGETDVYSSQSAVAPALLFNDPRTLAASPY